MCFYVEYDWSASIWQEDTQTVTGKPKKCEECERLILIGQKAYCVYGQEHEECRHCGHPYSLSTYTPCEGGKHNYGETFHYYRCDDCNKFLNAVQVAEEEAGCDYSEARPSLGEMINSIQDGGAREARKYVKVALREYPELRANGYLASLWKRMFKNDEAE